ELHQQHRARGHQLPLLIAAQTSRTAKSPGRVPGLFFICRINALIGVAQSWRNRGEARAAPQEPPSAMAR
ncbi:MAG TPA: hypothetical protein VEF90_02200, partial [Xanthobacteraceae bacterium]|nr:hypothetical protein [Xanthobacteraceae bacterium]